MTPDARAAAEAWVEQHIQETRTCNVSCFREAFLAGSEQGKVAALEWVLACLAHEDASLSQLKGWVHMEMMRLKASRT